MSRTRKLQPWQASMIRRAAAIRERYSVLALAQRFGVNPTTITRYAKRVHKDPRQRR